MYLENVVLDAADPSRCGRFWLQALGMELLTDDAAGLEARLRVPGGPVLDLCFPRVPDPPEASPRLHLDLAGGEHPETVVARLVELGASVRRPAGEQPWTVLLDPCGHPCCVQPHRPQDRGSGPVAEIPVDSADPVRDAEFWAGLSGWRVVASRSGTATALRHRSGLGPVLSFWPEPAPKPAGVKNGMHLDLRLEAGDELAGVVADVEARGGRCLDPGWGELAWTVLADPSGNEFCLLPARTP